MLRIVPAKPARTPPAPSAGRSAARADHVTHILFVCDDPADAQPCLHELAKAHFNVVADVAYGIADYVEQLHAVAYDVIVSCCSMHTDIPLRALDLLQNRAPNIPFILLAPATQRGIVDLFLANGAFDWVDRNHMELLPASVAVALEHRSACEERDRTSKALKGSQALHRALVDNPTYGVCQFDSEGRLLDVNQVLLDMLGYDSRDELLQMNIASDVMLNPGRGGQLLETYRRTGQVPTQDAEWKRKDGTPLIVRLGGRHVRDESAASCELILHDVTADRAHESHLEHLALTDALTGLANYRHLKRTVEAETQRSERTGRPFVVLLFDLDALKEINDRYGHVSGNRALCRLAAELRGSCRSMDTPTRCGGDEFAVVLPESGAREAAVIARRISLSLAADPEEPHLSVSVGIAVYPDDGAMFDTLLQSADRALYAMKRQHGRVFAGSDAVAAPPSLASDRQMAGGRPRRHSTAQDDSQE